MSLDSKKIIFKKYDEFSLAENEKDKERLCLEIESMIKKEPDLNSNCYHIWGLIYYETNNWRSNIEKTISNFQKAIKQDQSNFFPQLYLAHCYHDLGKLEQALENYLKVDQESLKKFATWRYVKLIEQIGYCNYKLGNKKDGEKHFEIVLEWYKKLDDDDHLAVPSELIECLPSNHKIVKEIKKIEDYL
jgi:tetratricopeptide (TPR) repeat protein